MLVAVWLGVAATISAVARKAGPWYRVMAGSLAWPAYPVLIGASYARYRYVRRDRKTAATNVFDV